MLRSEFTSSLQKKEGVYHAFVLTGSYASAVPAGVHAIRTALYIGDGICRSPIVAWQCEVNMT